MFSHEKIAEIALRRFKTLPKCGKPNDKEWTVLSAIVKSDGDDFQVVALATGSKCVGKSSMSASGDILNDSHAEVLCRRAFVRYLYSQLTGGDVFVRGGHKYDLKKGVRFHFFTTQVPCGDASIILKDDGDCVDAKRPKLDVYRTGAKCIDGFDAKGEGVEYHTLGAIRTKPGRGDPTLSMSCSDKLSKWCHLGWQGALLTLLLGNPIYISSITVAGNTPYDLEALKRALHKRFAPIKLNLPYELKELDIAQTVHEFDFAKSNDKNACPSSVIYCDVDEKKVEVAVDGRKQGVTKKNAAKKSARLLVCKLELFRLFSEIAKPLGLYEDDDSYVKCKRKAEEYYTNWNEYRKCVGSWSNKNEALLNFIL